MSSFVKTPGWLDWCPHPSTPRFRLPAGAVDAHCHVFGPGGSFSVRSRAEVHPVRREQGAAVRAARSPRLRAERDRTGDLSRLGQPRDDRRLRRERRTGARCRHSPAQRDRRELDELHARRRARRPLQLRSSDWSTSPLADELLEIARRVQCARLARGRVLRGAGPARPVARASRRCPRRSSSTTWAGPTSAKPVDGPEFALFMALMREHHNVWSKVSCPERLSVTGPPALDGERDAYRDVVPFARRGDRGVPRPRAVGHRLAAPEPEGAHARRWAAGRLHPAHRADDGAAAEAAGRPIRCASTGPRRSDAASTSPTSTSPARPSSTPIRRARGTG